MTDTPKTWFITGASRGIGSAIAQAALDAGDTVVATARDPESLATSVPASERVLHVALDVVDPVMAEKAVDAALARFDRIDVLVNNAGYGQLGVFEEIDHEKIVQQFDVNVFGTMHVTRAVLPAMRGQKSGRIFTMSSIGGVAASDAASIYCASKFAVEGFSDCLALEVAEFGIGVTIVEPGYFRTDFLDASSISFGDTPIADYADYSTRFTQTYPTLSGQQPGDPTKLARALVQLAHTHEAPTRFAAGSDAFEVIESAYRLRQAELTEWKELTLSTDLVT